MFESASIGSSRLDGAFTYDKRPKVPLLSGRLGGSRVLLADLGPTIGTPPPGSGEAKSAAATGGRVIPDKKFDLPSLRAMDANIVINVGIFDPGTDILDPLHNTRAHLLLADGVLTVADFEGTTAQGKLAGYLQLDGRGKEALWTADMRLLSVNLAQWLRIKRKGDAPPYLTGKLDALVKVKGTGRSAAEILASLDGDLRMHMRDAAVSHLAVEAAGLDLAQGLGMLIKGDDALPIQCNVADLDIVKGVARPKVFVVNTRDSTIWIDGTVSFRDESLDLRFVVSPKDFSPLTLRTPVRVRGTLGKPAVSLELGKLAGKAGAAGLLSLLNPLAAIIPFIDPGSKKDAAEFDAECAALARTSGVIPTAGAHAEVGARAAGCAGRRRPPPRDRPPRPRPRRSRSADQAAGLRAPVEERVLALRVRLAFCLGALHVFRFARVVGRRVTGGRLDLARLGEIAARLVVAAAGVVVAFALHLILVRCRGHANVSFAVGLKRGLGRGDCRLRLDHLVGDDVEAQQRARAEAHRDRHVARVAPAGHHDAADAAGVVARVRGVPAVAEKDLEPGAEVHRPGRRHADVAEVAGGVARRDVHAAAQRDREVGEVAADAFLLAEGVERGARRPRRLVVELQVLVDEVADRANARPAGRGAGRTGSRRRAAARCRPRNSGSAGGTAASRTAARSDRAGARRD